ncbi:MAG: SHOCT domain-containing protein [Sphaerochaetaceae bacterium]
MMLIWLLLIGVGVYYLVKTERFGTKSQEPSALDVVNRRYAKGEIDRETYLELRKDLD